MIVVKHQRVGRMFTPLQPPIFPFRLFIVQGIRHHETAFSEAVRADGRSVLSPVVQWGNETRAGKWDVGKSHQWSFRMPAFLNLSLMVSNSILWVTYFFSWPVDVDTDTFSNSRSSAALPHSSLMASEVCLMAYFLLTPIMMHLRKRLLANTGWSEAE